MARSLHPGSCPTQQIATAMPRRRVNQCEMSAIRGAKLAELPTPIKRWASAKSIRLGANPEAQEGKAKDQGSADDRRDDSEPINQPTDEHGATAESQHCQGIGQRRVRARDIEFSLHRRQCHHHRPHADAADRADQNRCDQTHPGIRRTRPVRRRDCRLIVQSVHGRGTIGGSAAQVKRALPQIRAAAMRDKCLLTPHRRHAEAAGGGLPLHRHGVRRGGAGDRGPLGGLRGARRDRLRPGGRRRAGGEDHDLRRDPRRAGRWSSTMSAEDDDFRGHPTPAMYGFQSYISVPIVHEGRSSARCAPSIPGPAQLKASRRRRYSICWRS